MVERGFPPVTAEEPRARITPIVVIVPGSGLYSRKSGKTNWLEGKPNLNYPKLSWDERQRLAATAQVVEGLEEEDCPFVVVTTAADIYEGFPALSMIERKELGDKYGVEKGLISEAEPSFNTVDDIEKGLERGIEVLKEKKVLKEGELPQVIVVSNIWHLSAMISARKRGLRFAIAERELIKRDRRYKRIVCGILLSPESGKLFVEQIMGAGYLLVRGEEKYKERAGREPGGENAEQFNSKGLPGKKKEPVVE